MTKSIYINGVDFTDMFTKSGYSVGYESVSGQNGGLMLDGSYTEDELAVKAVISLPCMPLTEEQLSKLLTTIYSTVYPKLYYYDPKSAAYRTIETIRSNTTQKFRGVGTNGKNYWTGTEIVLKER